METFLEFLGEVLKGIVREISAHFFRKNVPDPRGRFETTEKVRFFRLKKSPFSMQLLENGDFKLMF